MQPLELGKYEKSKTKICPEYRMFLLILSQLSTDLSQDLKEHEKRRKVLAAAILHHCNTPPEILAVSCFLGVHRIHLLLLTSLSFNQNQWRLINHFSRLKNTFLNSYTSQTTPEKHWYTADGDMEVVSLTTGTSSQHIMFLFL